MAETLKNKQSLPLRGKKVAVLGLGIEGKDLVNFLQIEGAKITVFDQKSKSEMDLTGVNTKDLTFVCGEDYLSHGFDGYDVIFRSPGIYRYRQELLEAEKNGTTISSAINLFFERCPARTIGVTGTKGKGTTSTLIYEILKDNGEDVYLAGNIGKPYLELLPKLKEKSFVIMELSSFQLIDLHKSPHIGVVLNITLDHMDWHKDRDEYMNAKKNLVAHQTSKDFAVLNADYVSYKDFEKETKGKIYYFSRRKKVKGCYVENEKILLNTDNETEIGDAKKLQLRGEHNWENVTAAICASYCAGASIESIRTSVFAFKGLEHRLELVRTRNGISFYNDSFSTNPQPTMAAVDSFNEPIILILGGSDKGLEYDEMARHIVEKGKVKGIILIGQIADQIAESLRNSKYIGNVVNLGMTTMGKVVSECMKMASKRNVILLSPASASFGMFTDYKDRGNQFKQSVIQL